MFMFIKITTFISTLYSSNFDSQYYEIYEWLISREKILIDWYILDVKDLVNGMKNSIEEEMKLFTKTFKNIVENHKTGNNVTKWPILPLPPTLEAQENNFIPFDADPNSIFQIRLSILRKLFFNDLLFYYYDFCYRMNEKFFTMARSCLQKLEELSELLTEVRKVKKISYDELNLGSVETLICENFNISDFFKELKNIVSESLEIKEDEIYRFLNTHLKLLNVCDDSQMFYVTYMAIDYYIRSYNKSMDDDEKSSLKYESISGYRFSIDPLIDFENCFLNCLTLNITKKFQKRSRSPEDKRFKTYKKSMKRIKNCKTCREYCKDMLKNLRCDQHQKILDEIRAEFFRSMLNSWFSCFIYIKDDILDELSNLKKTNNL